MKFIFITSPDDSGKSSVFNTLLLKDGSAPQAQIDRWKNIADNSPINVLFMSDVENLSIGSTWDETSKTFTLPDNPEVIKQPTATKLAIFLVNNVVNGILDLTYTQALKEALEEVYENPIKIITDEDTSLVEVGYTWDGTTFSPAE